MQLLRYKQDAAPVALIATLVATQFSVFFLVDNLYLVTAIAVLLVLPQGSATAVNHNHQHLPIFKPNALNRLLELGVFFNTGLGPFSWVLHHTLGHHMHYLDDEGDTCPWKKKDGSTMSRSEYTFKNTLKMYPQIFHVGKQHPALFKKFKFWFVISLMLLAGLIAYAPLKAVILFVVPMAIQLFLCVFATADHHRGLDTEDKYAATRNDLSWINNVYAWNLGYHTAHHIKCGLHWSKLPEFHEEIKDKIPAELIRELSFTGAVKAQSESVVAAPTPEKEEGVSSVNTVITDTTINDSKAA